MNPERQDQAERDAWDEGIRSSQMLGCVLLPVLLIIAFLAGAFVATLLAGVVR